MLFINLGDLFPWVVLSVQPLFPPFLFVCLFVRSSHAECLPGRHHKHGLARSRAPLPRPRTRAEPQAPAACELYRRAVLVLSSSAAHAAAFTAAAGPEQPRLAALAL
jgi:hypothetical protein